MANTLDYVAWRGDLPLDMVPINEVDEYIFTCIGKPDFSGIIPNDGCPVSLQDAINTYFLLHGDAPLGLVASSMTLPILKGISTQNRYKDISLSYFDKRFSVENTEQFSALTVNLPNELHYVTFRGTDDTIVGWKENCELAVLESVPAQRDALSYLERVASELSGPLIVSGHSKGGNLAIYAAANVSPAVQQRIAMVYSYDGPGFMDSFVALNGFQAIKKKIVTYVPQNSIVGMLLTHVGELRVVTTPTAGIAGHDGFTWNVTKNGFVRADELSKSSKIFHTAIKEALHDLSSDERKELVEDILDVLSSSNCFTLSEFETNSLQKALEVAKSFRKAKDLQAFILDLIENSIKEKAKG